MRKILLTIIVSFFGILISSCDHYPNQDNIPGSDKKFNPIKSLEKVKKFAGKGSVLIDIDARYVKPDGTMNFNAEYETTLYYRFIRQLEQKGKKNEESPVPLGVIKTEIQEPKWEYISITLTKQYTRNERDDDGELKTYIYGGMTKIHNPVPNSEYSDSIFRTCQAFPNPLPFDSIWNLASELGAPADIAVAVIKYQPPKGYSFKIENTEYNYEFDMEGNLTDK